MPLRPATSPASAAPAGQLYRITASERSGGHKRGILLKSADGGRSFERIDYNRPLSYVDFVTATRGYAETSGGLVTTSDGGRTWNAVAASAAFLNGAKEHP